MLADLATELARLQLRPAEASVLLLIQANAGITQSEIGRVLGIKRANMAPLAADLEERGLTVRRQVDGRSHGLLPTAEGHALATRAFAAMRAHEARFLQGLPAKDRNQLISLVHEIWR